jgi:hypothetical protein
MASDLQDLQREYFRNLGTLSRVNWNLIGLIADYGAADYERRALPTILANLENRIHHHYKHKKQLILNRRAAVLAANGVNINETLKLSAPQSQS